MFFTLLRGFGTWIATNWAGLAAGYAISDIATGVTAPKDQQPEPKSKVVQAMQKTFGFGVPVWLYGLVSAVLLFFIYRYLQKMTKK